MTEQVVKVLGKLDQRKYLEYNLGNTSTAKLNITTAVNVHASPNCYKSKCLRLLMNKYLLTYLLITYLLHNIL